VDLDPSKFSKQDIERFLAEAEALRAENVPREWYGKASNKQLPPDNPRHFLSWAHPVDGLVYRCSDRNPHCTAPSPSWRVWIYCGGRGVGKTMAGSNWVIERALSEPDIDVAVCAPTFSAVQRVCFEGPTGIIKQAQKGEIKAYNRNNVIIYMRNGSRILGFSAENTDSIRGANLTYAWLDELAVFPDPEFYTHGLRPALRIKRAGGLPPQMMVTTTPKGVKLMRDLMKSVDEDPEHYHLTRATSYENPERDDDALADMRHTFGRSTSAMKQELEAELSEDDGMLFHAEDFDAYRVDSQDAPDEYRQVVIGVDPATTSKEDSDYSGIVVIGEGQDKHSYVLEDCSVKGSPEVVTKRIAAAYHRWSADLVVVENNAAGDYFSTLMAQTDPYVACRPVHAMKGKKIRAMPVAHLNGIGRIHMVGDPENFRILEEELCGMNPDQDRDKIGDDRADAFIWAMHHLAGKSAVDWAEVYGFGSCKHCGANVNFISDKTCRSCGEPVIADKQQEQFGYAGEKAAVRWWNAYMEKCPKGHKYAKKYRTCPECAIGPEEFLARALAFSGQGSGKLAYKGKNWLRGRGL
jgi:phage terminase large subunit-like protein